MSPMAKSCALLFSPLDEFSRNPADSQVSRSEITREAWVSTSSNSLLDRALSKDSGVSLFVVGGSGLHPGQRDTSHNLQLVNFGDQFGCGSIPGFRFFQLFIAELECWVVDNEIFLIRLHDREIN